MKTDTDLVLVRALRRFPYNERAFSKDSIIQMSREHAVSFQRVGMVKIENITLEQRVDGTFGRVVVTRMVKP